MDLSKLTDQQRARGKAAMLNVQASHGRIRGVVIPLYGEKPNGVPFLTGSGFMLRLAESAFFITASHTLDIYPSSPLFVPVEGKHVGLNASFTRVRGNDDQIDVAYARLDGRTPGLETGFRAVTLEEIDSLDWPGPNRMYSFVGYPHSVNKARLTTKTFEPTIQPYTSHKPLADDDYRSAGLDPHLSVAAFFDLSRAEEHGTARVVTPRAPVGISGGPVWRLGSFAELQQGTNRERVVGVATSFRRKPDILVGTRISLVLEAIRHQFPEMSELLPRNPRYLRSAVTQRKGVPESRSSLPRRRRC